MVYKTKLQTVLSCLQEGKTLDVGCGDKRYTNRIPNSIGIDPNSNFEGMTCIPDYIMSATDLEFPDGSFENVTALDVLEHVQNPKLAINEAHRVLKPNGILVIVDPNDDVLFWARIFAFRIREAIRGNPDHKHRFNSRNLKILCDPQFKMEKVIGRWIFTVYKFRRKSDEL